MIPTKAKPMRKRSKLEKKLQRAADGGIVVWILKLNGLSRAARNEKSRRCREPNPLSIRRVCQYMERVDIEKCQVEWYRDNK